MFVLFLSFQSNVRSFTVSLLAKRSDNSEVSLVYILTLSLPSATVVLYANSLNLNETLINSASHPDPSCLSLRQYFHKF